MGMRQAGLAAVYTACVLSWSPASAEPAGADAACTALAQLSLHKTHITQAELIRPQPDYIVPGTESNPPERGGPTRLTRPFCRVAGISEPAIRFEVWLPLSGWNRRFEGLGNGAFAGSIPYPAMAQALSQDFAVGGTDTGHQSGFADASWTQSASGLNAEVLADWSHRGMHEMSIQGQAVVQAFYGETAAHRYFVGCSSGGHQALTEAQRYPDDYDGILAGAPANYWTHLMAGQLWYGLATRTDPATNLEAPQNQLALIHATVLKACDSDDGLADGVIENPLACKFDPKVLACKGADPSACLSAPQVNALRKIYGNAPDRGRKLFPGLAPGSEMGWASMSANQVPFAQTFYRYIVFQNPGWNYADMNFSRDVAYADAHVGSIVNSVEPDLSAFRRHGGKLLQYHGWNDPLISPYNSIDYYESVVAAMGRGKPRAAALTDVQSFHRLFMVPGMNHCRGGDGADSFDALQSLIEWVEKGDAPLMIQAAKLSQGKPIRTHPLCPYPTVARYRGSGDGGDAQNFECALP